MYIRASIIVIFMAATVVAASGCISGNQSTEQKSVPFATTTVTVNSVEAMQGFNTSLSCTLNKTNGEGLNNQTVYWYMDSRPLFVGKTFFGFASYNISATDTFKISVGEHEILVEYHGDANYVGTKGEGLLVMREKFQPKPSPTPMPSPSPSPRPSPSPSVSPTPSTATPLPSPSSSPTRTITVRPSPSPSPTIPSLPAPSVRPRPSPSLPPLP